MSRHHGPSERGSFPDFDGNRSERGGGGPARGHWSRGYGRDWDNDYDRGSGSRYGPRGDAGTGRSSRWDDGYHSTSAAGPAGGGPSRRPIHSRSPSPALNAAGSGAYGPRHSYGPSQYPPAYADRSNDLRSSRRVDADIPQRERDRERERERDFRSRDGYYASSRGGPSTRGDSRRSSPPPSIRGDGGYGARRRSPLSPPQREREREKSPVRGTASMRRGEEDPFAPPTPPRARTSGPPSSSADASATTLSSSASNHIPTGPRASGGNSTAWGSSRGISERGRGRGLGIRGRGRRGGYGSYDSGHSAQDDAPAKSLARKVDAGGNALTPDLMPMQGGDLDQNNHDSVEAGELEEGEAREEEEGETIVSSAPETGMRDRTSGAVKEEVRSRREASKPHLGSLPPHRGSWPSQRGQASSGHSNTTPASQGPPSTPSAANPYATTPTAWAQQQQQTGSSVTPPVPSATSLGPTRPKYPLPASAFAHSLQPEWDAEIFALTHHRLAALHRLPLSTAFAVGSSAARPVGSASGATTPAAVATPSTETPGLGGDSGMLTGTPVGSSAATTVTSTTPSLRQALLELRDAQLEMEMSAFRRDEIDRARAALV